MALQTFRENEHLFEVTTLMVNNVVWLKAREVAASLGYVDASQALRKNIEDDDKKTYSELMKGRPERPPNQQPHEIYINEPGLYSLVMRSHMPQATKFKHWVTHKVLPSLRKFGTYSVEEVHQSCTALLAPSSAIEVEEKANHLYIMKYSFDNTTVKIGCTQDVERRRQQLQSCHNFTVEIVAYFSDAGHLETAVHIALAPRRSCQGSGREWFTVDAHTAIAIVTGTISASTPLKNAAINNAKRRRLTTLRPTAESSSQINASD